MSSDQKSNHKIKVGDIEQKIENSIEDDDVWRAVESFVQENGMVSGQIRSFNDFIYNKSHEIIKLFKQVVIEEKSKDSPKKYVLELSDLTYKEPFFTEKDDSTHDLYPVEALQRNITYCSAMYIDVTVITPSGESTFYEKIFLGNMPVMTRSDLCHVGSIVGDPEQIAKNNEDFYDGGGYFVISPKGEGSVAQRRILVPQERSAPNKVYIFSNRKMHPKYQKYAEIRSSGDHVHMTTTTVGFMPSGYNGRISAVLPWIDATEIPLGVLFFALGATSYQEICTFVVGPPNEGDKWTDESTKEILGILLTTLEYSFEIQDQESALYFIGKKGRKFVNDKENGDLFDKDFSDEEDEIDMAAILKEKSSAISYARHLLTSEFLSHVGNHFDTSEEKAIEKAKYLGYVVNKLILVILGKKNPESRDHYMNKRILSTGALLAQQFYGGLRRLIMEITKNTRKALRYGNTVNISSWIKPSIITNAMQGAISGNNWTTGGPAAKGISQVYEQFNYASSIANARKDTVPIAADGGKVIEPRDLHGTHFGLICVTGDTLVLLADGKTLCRIDELENKAVMTVNTVSLKSEPSGIYNFFKMMPKQLLEIKDDCGRVLKCTPDHPFLVHIDGENVWVSAGNLKIGDKVVVENTNHFKPGSDTIVLPIKNLSYELKSTGLLNPIDEKKAGIIAGLLGASFTNGHICKKEGKYLQSEFYLGELNDALELQEDIYRLGFGSSYIGRKHTIYKCDGQEPMNYATWVVTKGGDFARMLVDLGAPVGKKGTQTLKTPLWIKNAPNFVKKEWLSAFQGGDGSKLGMWKNQKTFKISLNSTIIRNSKNETMEFFTDMVEMYEHFGIQCFLETKEKNYILSFAGNRENLFKYSQLIDYKYCNHKKRASSIVINFLKHWNYKQTKQKAIYDKVLKASSFNINLGVTKNQYYKIRNNKNVNPRPIIDISLFQNRSLLEGKCISYISEISEIELEPVYDFTTISENHSFISNEFVTHQCPSETPEGKKAGLVKNMAFMSLITLGTDFEPIRLLLTSIIGTSAKKHYPASLLWTKVFLNGVPIGHTKRPKKITSTIRSYRRTGKITPEISVVFFESSNDIHICIDSGRLCRPLFIVENGKLLFDIQKIRQLELGELTWSDLLVSGTIELIDKMEEEECLIAGFPSDLETSKDRMDYTHCEIHPALMYGIGGSIIPFPDHNQSPRNCYQSSMGKQAVGIPFSNYRTLMCGSFHTLMYLHKPLALTKSASIIRFDEMPAGQNAIVAIMPRPFNEEDSIEMNQDSIDRGFMVSFKWTCFYAEIREENLETFGIPKEGMKRFKGDPSHLTKHGYPKPGQKLKKGDIVIGKITEHISKGTTEYVSSSQLYDHEWPSTVDKVMTGTTGEGYKFIRVMLCQRREPIVGDKFSFMHGQKGTIGMKPRAIDLPFNKQGISPDIVMNSLALPSRMTIGMLVEAWTGKVVISTSLLHNTNVSDFVECKNAHDGDEGEKSPVVKKKSKTKSVPLSKEFKDMFCHKNDSSSINATPFRKIDIDVIRKEMSKYGMEYGDEYLTDGITGKRLRALVFFVPAHSQRLKHMVIDKIHARARGGKTTLMRQPHEGRAAGGGLRFGVMERDCILGQGAGKITRDRLIICSDDFRQWVCDICGLAVGNKNDGCKICGLDKVSNVRIPYGTKIVNQELMALNIVPRILTTSHSTK